MNTLTFNVFVVVNTHCHYDHVEANYLFKGRPLIIHEKEYEYCAELYWPEWRGAYLDIMKVETVKGPKKLTENVRIMETFGHTPGSISVLAETRDGLVACIGDAAVVKEDYLEFRPPMVVTKNINSVVSVESLKRVAALKPVLVIPGHDAPFRP